MTDKPDLRAVLEWRPLGDSHLISNTGKVWSLRFHRELKGGRTQQGYPTIWLDGKTRYVHDLVLTTFVGPRPSGAVARHLNDIPDDNRVWNLAWGTRSQNALDAVRNGRQLGGKGEAAHKAKVTEPQVREIRAYRTYGFTVAQIAKWYGLSAEGASSIIRRRNWSHVR